MPLYSYKKVKRKGKIDGRNWKWKFWPFIKQKKPQSPRPNQQEPASFELELKRAVENEISKVTEMWKRIDEKLKMEYCRALSSLEMARKSLMKESQESDEAKEEFLVAEEKYKNLEHPALDTRWRNFWLFFIAIAEFPLNSIVFALFGAGRLETYIMAAGICIALPVLAHFLGKSLRQENRSKTDKLLLIVMPLTLFLILAVIAYIRGKYFQTLKVYKLLGVQISAPMMTVLFVIINIAIFLVAVLVSYEGSHPNQQQYHNTIKRYREALKKLQKESAEADEAGRVFASAHRRFQMIQQKRKKKHQQYLQKGITLQDHGEWLISVYRAANLNAREDTPPCFRQAILKPEIPQELANIDWDCPEMDLEKKKNMV